MATAATLIDRSLRLLGQIASGGHATTEEYADGLTALNAMMDSWRNDSLFCYANRTEVLTLSSSTTSYSIGPTGTLVTTRPVKIEAAWVVSSNVSYSCDIISDEEYDAIPDKAATASWPTKVNYRATMTNGTLYVWPVPNATATLDLRTWTPFTAFATTSDTVSLPPGWEEALAYNLAIEMAPEFQVQPSAAVAKRAVESIASLKRANFRPINAVSELPLLLGGRRPSIFVG